MSNRTADELARGRMLYDRWAAHQARQGVMVDEWDDLEETDRESWTFIAIEEWN